MTGIACVAIVQHPPVYLNLNASVAKAVDLIAEAGEKGAEVIAFPRPGCRDIRSGWIWPPRSRPGITAPPRRSTACWSRTR